MLPNRLQSDFSKQCSLGVVRGANLVTNIYSPKIDTRSHSPQLYPQKNKSQECVPTIKSFPFVKQERSPVVLIPPEYFIKGGDKQENKTSPRHHHPMNIRFNANTIYRKTHVFIARLFNSQYKRLAASIVVVTVAVIRIHLGHLPAPANIH